MKELDFDRDIVPLRDRMFRYAQSLLLCAAEAEDVVHDLLERFWRERERLCVRSDVGSFVMTVLETPGHTWGTDSLRRREADRRRGEAAACRTERFAAEDAERWEARELVRRAMACLPERQRETLHLKDIEGVPTCELARMLGCDEAQVRVILSRARHGLREALKKWMDDERTTKTD